MSSFLEEELKFELAGPAEFHYILEQLGPAQRVLEQQNHYFSDRPQEPSPDWVLRLRQQDQQQELTLKTGRSQQRGLFTALETSCPLGPAQAEAVLRQSQWDWDWPPLRQLQELHRPSSLYYLGCLSNRRHCCPQAGGWLAELDESRFPDGSVDYELEIETNQVESVLAQLQPLMAWLTPQSKTKYRRFLERCGGVLEISEGRGLSA